MRKNLVIGAILVIASLLWAYSLYSSGTIANSILNMYGWWIVMIIGVLLALSSLRNR